MAIDPVCGMEVEDKEGMEEHLKSFTATYEGTTYHFCSEDCKDEFQSAPEDYIGDFE